MALLKMSIESTTIPKIKASFNLQPLFCLSMSLILAEDVELTSGEDREAYQR